MAAPRRPRALTAPGSAERELYVDLLALAYPDGAAAPLTAAFDFYDEDSDVDGVLLWGYVLTQALVLPIAAAWAFAERTRWSSVVLLVAAVTVAFLEFRLLQIWGTV